MMSLDSYLDVLSRPVNEPSMEPELDDIDEKADAQMKEQVALSSGAIKKGIIEQGQGTEHPRDGDLVYFHLSVKKENGEVLESSRLEEDGSGLPKAFILGKGRRAPRGWEMALEEMLKGERSVFKIAPEFSYAQKGCLLDPPGGVSRDAALMLDIQLVNFYRKSEVKAVGEDGVILRTLRASQSWEHPRPPFEVNMSIKARVPSSSGRQGEGTPFYATDIPLRWALGSGQVGSLLEEGIGAMAKSERAIISCAGEKDGGLIPAPPQGVDRVEYEVELHSMIQVRDLTGSGEVTKRRIKEGVGEFPIDCPLEDNAVVVHFKATIAGTDQVVYDSRGLDGTGEPLEFDTGVNAVPEAVDMCVRLMTPQEVATATSVSRLAYDGRSDRPPGCPEGSDICFEIELLSFDKTPHWHGMTAGDKIRRAEQVRQQGNVVFRQGQLGMARQKYLKAMKLLDNAYDTEGEQEARAASNAKASCLTNLALISQKEGNLTECFTWCEKALREQPDHPKALFRKATTHVLLGDYKQAEADFLHVKQSDPGMAADIDKELAKMKQRQRAANIKEKQDFGSFFDRKK